MSTPARMKLGDTLFGGNSVASGSQEGLIGQSCFWDRDNNPSTPTVLRTNSGKMTIIVKNSAATALLPGRLVTWKAGAIGKEVDGYATVTAALCAGVVDDRLSSAGVAVGDYFHLIVKGSALVLQALSNLTLDVAATGATADATGLLYAITAITSGATTAGRFTNWVGTFSAAETTDGTAGKILRNAIGRAISTSLTSNTNGQVLAWLDLPWGVR
jgi:hypothetical protein